MASSIGDVTVISITGCPDRPGQKTENIVPPHVSGNVRRKTSRRGGERELIAYRDVPTLSDAVTLETELKAMEGTIKTIIKDGITYPDYMIVSVDMRNKAVGTRACGGVTPHGPCLMEFSVTVEDAATP